MMRVVAGALLGAAVLFVWNAVSWMVIPWHHMEAIDREDAVVRALQGAGLGHGVYAIPGLPDQPAPGDDAAAFEAWTERHRAGPLAMLVYDPEGHEPMPLNVFFVGFGLSFAVAMTAAIALALAARGNLGYPGRVTLVTLMGLFAGLGSHLAYWNWMNWPLRYCLELGADSAAGALLMGLVMAGVVGRRSDRVTL
jgi:hypothetical protein